MPAAILTGVLVGQASRQAAVHVAGAPATADDRRICARLLDVLPNRLGSLRARRVAGDTTGAAAWGDPPIVLRCGLPPRGAPVGDLVTLDGVDWTPEPDHAGVTWTTVGRRVTVRVRFPRQYDGQGPLLATLSPQLMRIVPRS